MPLTALVLAPVLLLAFPSPSAGAAGAASPEPVAAQDAGEQTAVRALQISVISGLTAGGLATAIALGFGAATWGLSPEEGPHPTRPDDRTWSPLFTTLGLAAAVGGNVVWVTTLTSFLVQAFIPGE